MNDSAKYPRGSADAVGEKRVRKLADDGDFLRPVLGSYDFCRRSGNSRSERAGARGGRTGKKKDKSAKRRKDSLKKIWDVVADMVKNYVQILRLRAIRFILGASIFYLIGYAIFCSDRMYFFTYNMRLSPGAITVVMAIMTFASSVFVPVIPALGRRFDKRTLFIAGMALSVAVMGLYGFIGVSSLAAAGIYAIAYCMGSICYWQLIPAMIYDVCESGSAGQSERTGRTCHFSAVPF